MVAFIPNHRAMDSEHNPSTDLFVAVVDPRHTPLVFYNLGDERLPGCVGHCRRAIRDLGQYLRRKLYLA